MLWAVLACVAILHTGGYYWNHLEPCGTLRIFPDVPYPQYLKYMAALVCRSPPFSSILFLCSGVCWHALPFSLQPDTIGTHWNHHEPPKTIWKLHYLEPPGTYTTLRFSWMCPTPSTLNVWLQWCASPPPFHTFYSHPRLFWYALPSSLLVNTIGTTWNHVELLGFSWMCPTPST